MLLEERLACVLIHIQGMHFFNSLGWLVLLVGTDIFLFNRFPKQVLVPVQTELVHWVDII